MRERFCHILSLVLIFPVVFPLLLFGQTPQNFLRYNFAQPPAVPWSLALENANKVFIQNKGQFKPSSVLKTNSISLLDDNKIRYGVRYNGVDIYFTPDGVTFMHTKYPELSEEEREKLERQPREAGGKETNPGQNKQNSIPLPELQYLNMKWIDANPDVKVVADNKVNNYFMYSDLRDQSGKSTIKANAFKKIIYKDIYPGIDVEYTFPDTSAGLGMTSGIKYTLILHPGADVTKIKCKYEGAKSISTDAQGNLKIISDFGEFIDHAPVSYYQNGEPISSAFKIKGNIVSFVLNLQLPTSNLQSIIIDPWTTIPTFTGTNSAFDIDWDYNGNIYIYGGSNIYQLIKLNNAGAIQWTYSCNSFYNILPYYGDFATDRVTGTSYICEAWNGSSPTRILKINSAGTQIGMFPGSTDINEMWRIAYNSCTHQGVIACGNTTNYYQAATFDTNMTSITAVNVVAATQSYIDMALLAIDDTSCYMLTAENGWTIISDSLIKCPLATLSPTTYRVAEGHHFVEVASVTYTGTNRSNGFNGMAKGSNYLYTYNGAVLKKRNPWTGAFISSVVVGTDSFSCGGIAVDGCDNVFVGTANGVREYNSALGLVTSVATADTVYDVTLGIGGEIFACGSGFVSALPLFSACSSSSSFTLTTSATNSTCAGNDGTATVNVTGGTPPFNYIWLPGGQTSQTATGLAPGKYKVIVYENNGLSCSNSGASVDTVIVYATSGFTGQSHSSTTITCFGGSDGTATEVVTGGTPLYTYLWSPGGQTTQTATGLLAGTYIVTVIDASGCQTIDSVQVSPPPSVLSVVPQIYNIDCSGNPGSIILSVGGGTQPYTFLWSDGTTSQDIYFINSPSTYSVVVKDANGCSITLTGLKVDKLIPWSISSVNVSNTCSGNNGKIVLKLANDSLFTMYYYWYDSFGNFIPGDSVVTNLGSGTYTCYVYGYSGFTFCNDSTIIVTINAGSLTANTAKYDPTCFGNNNGKIWITSIAGTGPYTYSWNTIPVQTTDTAKNLISGTYVCTIMDSTGCSTTQSVTITQPTALTATTTVIDACGGNTGQITSVPSGGTPGYTCSWSSGPTTCQITNLASQNYTVTVTDANLCTFTKTAFVNLITVTANAGPDQTICEGNTAQLNAIGGTGYSWTPTAALNNPSIFDPIASPTLTTQYIVTVSSGVCSAKDTVNVIVLPAFVVSAGPDTTIVEGESVQLTASGGITYLWIPPTGLDNQSIFNPVATPDATTTYTVLITNGSGCTMSDVVTIFVNEIVCGDVNVPTAFSPNNDGENDVLFVRGKCIVKLDFYIYSRWGEKVFESHDAANGWDGIHRGKMSDTGVFTYYLDALFINSIRVKKDGNITLVK